MEVDLIRIGPIRPLALAFLGSAVIMAFTPAVASATCGTSKPFSYDDIEAVTVTNDYRTSDGYRDKTYPVSNMAASTYWLFFWAGFPTEYSQFTLKGSVGTFHLEATLADARKLLKQDAFYSLSPDRHCCVTEETESVVTVLRCAVVTRIIMYNDLRYQEPATAKLFTDFAELVRASAKTRVSSSAGKFKPTLLFDP
jgi:hypothetical protein